MALNPLHQFEVVSYGTLNIGGFSIDFTNQAAWMLAAVAIVIGLFGFAVRPKAMVPGRMQAFAELTYEFVESLITGTAGHHALRFLPFIFTLFVFLAAVNLIGMVPGSYTATSQIALTATMAFAVFAIVLFCGFKAQGLKFLGHFLPAGTPWWLAPLVVPLELISFFARPFTLAIRLAANMVAGHVLLKLFASFIIMLGGWFALSAVAPLLMLIAISALEVFVALLQAYIFTVRTCVYLNDALHSH